MAEQPAELKRGVENHLTSAAAARREQEEALLSKDNISTGKFEESIFVTQLVEFSFTRSGDVLVKLRVPYIYRDQASHLKDAYGVMLECSLHKWSQAEEARRNG